MGYRRIFSRRLTCGGVSRESNLFKVPDVGQRIIQGESPIVSQMK